MEKYSWVGINKKTSVIIYLSYFMLSCYWGKQGHNLSINFKFITNAG